MDGVLLELVLGDRFAESCFEDVTLMYPLKPNALGVKSIPLSDSGGDLFYD